MTILKNMPRINWPKCLIKGSNPLLYLDVKHLILILTYNKIYVILYL